MFDEADYDGAMSLTIEEKVAHYEGVLNPKPESENFLRSLPDPRPFGHFINQTRDYLKNYPLALVGEIGLDRSFRIPEVCPPEQAEERDEALTPGGREGRRLSPYRVSLEHQKKVLRAQLNLAGGLQRAVSVHGVQAHGVVYDTLAETWKGFEKEVLTNREAKRRKAAVKANAEPFDAEQRSDANPGPEPFPPRVCLHSYSGSAEAVKQYIAPSVPVDVFFSFSTTINAWAESGDGKVEAALRAVPDDRVLVESDMHTAGEEMDHQLEMAVRKICQVKEWELGEGVKQLGQNWHRFVFGRR